MTTTILLVLGLVMLFLGRKVFVLFVGVAGFAAGLTLAPQIFGDLPETTLLVVAILCGAAGVVLALLLRRIAVAAAGFFAGGFLGMNLAGAWWEMSGPPVWGAFAIGGILGAIVVSSLFDWALIVLSSVVGAALIVQALHLSHGPVVITLLAVVGILVQARLKRETPKTKED